MVPQFSQHQLIFTSCRNYPYQTVSTINTAGIKYVTILRDTALKRLTRQRRDISRPQLDRRDLNRTYQARQRTAQLERIRPAARSMRRR